MANILLLTLVFAPDGVSTSTLMTELAQELQSQGHAVTVLTTTPHYNMEPEARSRQPLRPYWGKWLQRSDLDGIPVYHASVAVKSDRIGARLLDYLRFHLISTLAGLFAIGKFDVMLVPSPPLTIGFSAWILRLLRGAPFIYNVQEIYPDVAVSLGVIKNRRVIWALEELERFIYRQSCHVTVISEGFRRRLLEKGVPATKMSVIPNFVDIDFIQPQPEATRKQNAFARTHSLTNKFVVLYAGNIGLTQNFETILAAACHLQGLENLQFVIVGDGARRRWLEEQLTTQQLTNILLLPFQARSVVPQIYATSDLCLVPLKRGTATETFPSKIYTIMAAGRPVVVAADPDSELAWVVKHTGCGWAVPSDNVAAIATTLSAAYHEQATLAARGQAGRAFVVAHHSRGLITAQYDTLIRRLIPTPMLAKKFTEGETNHDPYRTCRCHPRPKF